MRSGHLGGAEPNSTQILRFDVKDNRHFIMTSSCVTFAPSLNVDPAVILKRPIMIAHVMAHPFQEKCLWP